MRSKYTTSPKGRRSLGRAAPRPTSGISVLRRRLRDILGAYLFVLPAALVLVVFQIIPAIEVFRLSLTNRLLLRPTSSFTGLANIERLLSDDRFWNSVWNTFYFVGVSVPLQTGLALLLAILLAKRMRGLAIFRTIFFLPVVASMVGVSVIWDWMFHPSIGIFNAILTQFGLEPINWLRDPLWAMPAIILLVVWKGTGYYMVIYLAGLMDIPDQYYDAANIDGANRWHLFRYVTWPLLAPTTYLIFILQMINSFQVFATVYVLTGGGPRRATEVVVYYLYERAFQSLEFGYASTISVALFLFLLALTAVQRGIFGRRQNYDR